MPRASRTSLNFLEPTCRVGVGQSGKELLGTKAPGNAADEATRSNCFRIRSVQPQIATLHCLVILKPPDVAVNQEHMYLWCYSLDRKRIIGDNSCTQWYMGEIC